MATDVIAVLEDADAAGSVDPTSDGLLSGLRFLVNGYVPIDDLEGRWVGELEAPDRWDVAEGLMVSVMVVLDHPGSKGRLGLLDRVEAVLVKELLAHGLVEPFDLAGGGR